MKKQEALTLTAAALGMLILILDGKTAIAGAREGIDLCIRTLVPSLFPFFLLSSLLTGTLVGQPLKLLGPVGGLCGIPKGTESLLAVGFLGGYPVGAQNVGQAWDHGQITESDAERMLAFCNNAGPAFLFGMISPLFSESKTAWLLWGVHIASALLVGILTAERHQRTANTGQPQRVTCTAALERSVRVMATVCGWVIIFRIILTFLDNWIFWLMPAELRVLLSGFLELSNGCVQLADVGSEGMRFILAGIMLSFGGICVMMQTAAAASGLSLRAYFPEKLLQCCITFFLCVMLQPCFPAEERWHCQPLHLIPAMLLTAILVIKQKRNKKTSSIPALVGV